LYGYYIGTRTRKRGSAGNQKKVFADVLEGETTVHYVVRLAIENATRLPDGQITLSGVVTG